MIYLIPEVSFSIGTIKGAHLILTQCPGVYLYLIHGAAELVAGIGVPASGQ